jgi:DNA repair exonuclease SbcCD ATPase subunit
MEQSVELSPSEAAYFESGGNTEIVAAPEQPQQTEQAPAIDPAAVAAAETLQERDDKGRFVPHQALHAEREEHKKTKAELEEIRKRQAVLDDRWNTILKLQEQPKQEPTAPPDPNEDIFAFSKWQADRLKELEEKVTSRDKQEEQARTLAQEEQAVWNHWSESAKAYEATQTDFGDAVKHLSDMRMKQLAGLAAIEPTFATEQGRLGQINAELKQIVIGAKQAGQNPAQVVYELAKVYGFAPPAATDPAKVELPEKLAAIDAAQAASRTLATPGGRSASEPMTAETIANMSTSEFEAWMKAPENQKLFNKLMGG